MLAHPTIEQLHAMGPKSMAKALVDLTDNDDARALSHAEWLGLLLERETTLRHDRRLAARLRFANGCVANTTASRVSLKTERKLRIFQDDAYLSMDLQQKILTVIRKKPPGAPSGPLPVIIEEQNLEQGDALKAEIESFLGCVRSGAAPVVTGEDGLRALETALRITEQVRSSATRVPS